MINVGKTDKLIRIAFGAFLVLLTLNQSIGSWGYLGIIFIATGVFRWCPLYSLIGIQTSLLHENIKR